MEIAKLAERHEIARTVFGSTAEDDVVEQFDFEQVTGASEVARDADVGLGRQWIAAGVIMGKDDGVGVGRNGAPKHFAGVDGDLVEDSLGHGLHANQAAAGIQHDNLQSLDIPAGGFVPQECRDCLRGVQNGRFTPEFLGHPRRKGKGGLQGDSLVASHPTGPEFIHVRTGEGFQGAEPLEQRFCDGDGRRAADPRAQENGDQFGVAQGRGAPGCKPFSGTILELHVEDLRCWHRVVWHRGAPDFPKQARRSNGRNGKNTIRGTASISPHLGSPQGGLGAFDVLGHLS